MYDAYEVLENTCNRAMKELYDIDKKLSKNDSSVSKEDVELMESLTHTVASCKKGIAMMDKYSHRRSSNRRARSRDYDIMQKLDNMYQDARDDDEAEIIQNIMNELSR